MVRGISRVCYREIHSRYCRDRIHGADTFCRMSNKMVSLAWWKVRLVRCVCVRVCASQAVWEVSYSLSGEDFMVLPGLGRCSFWETCCYGGHQFINSVDN